MTLSFKNKLFGTPLRTRILLSIALLEETFPAELARLLGNGLYSIQRITASLEKEGIIVSRKLGVERRLSLNPRYYAYNELKALLYRLGESDSALCDMLSERRARPRRTGKEI